MKKRFVFPTKAFAFRALVLAPFLPIGILFVLDSASRTIQQGPLAIAGAALLALYILIVMEVCAVVVGGAVLAAVWERIPFNGLVCAALGGFIANVPLLGLMLLPQHNFDAWYDGDPTVINGVKTTYGYWRDALAVGEVFVFGAIGGAIFWWLCRPSKFAKSQND